MPVITTSSASITFDVARVFSLAVFGGLITPCMRSFRSDSIRVESTIAASARANTRVSEYGHAVFAAVIIAASNAVELATLSSPAKAGDPVFQRQSLFTERPRRTGYPAFAGYDTACGA